MDNVEIIVKLNLFLKRKKVGVTERPRSLNSIKAMAMASCPISLFTLVLSPRAQCMMWHVDLHAQ